MILRPVHTGATLDPQSNYFSFLIEISTSVILPQKCEEVETLPLARMSPPLLPEGGRQFWPLFPRRQKAYHVLDIGDRAQDAGLWLRAMGAEESQVGSGPVMTYCHRRVGLSSLTVWRKVGRKDLRQVWKWGQLVGG